MLLLSCPFCGDRNESEFLYGGPARATRGEAANATSDGEWIEYLTVTPNPRGPVQEKWWHKQGCGMWIVIERDTVTHRIAPERASDAQ
jgi:sarcosine oxidase subunit delta